MNEAIDQLEAAEFSEKIKDPERDFKEFFGEPHLTVSPEKIIQHVKWLYRECVFWNGHLNNAVSPEIGDRNAILILFEEYQKMLKKAVSIAQPFIEEDLTFILDLVREDKIVRLQLLPYEREISVEGKKVLDGKITIKRSEGEIRRYRLREAIASLLRTIGFKRAALKIQI